MTGRTPASDHAAATGRPSGTQQTQRHPRIRPPGITPARHPQGRLGGGGGAVRTGRETPKAPGWLAGCLSVSATGGGGCPVPERELRDRQAGPGRLGSTLYKVELRCLPEHGSLWRGYCQTACLHPGHLHPPRRKELFQGGCYSLNCLRLYRYAGRDPNPKGVVALNLSTVTHHDDDPE